MQQNEPFQLPGFGCSYWKEFSGEGEGAHFSLSFVRYGETRLFPAAEVGSTSLGFVTFLEAGRAQVSRGQGQPQNATASHWVAHQWGKSTRPQADLAVESRSFLLKVVCVQFRDKTLERVSSEFNVSFEQLNKTLVCGVPLEKSVWIEEVLHRYIFERTVGRKDDSLSAQFCEIELLKELFYAHKKQVDRRGAPDLAPHSGVARNHLSPSFQRALDFIEENLQIPLSTSQIAKASALSESSLLRHFRSELSTTPMKHVWRRRLQEARLLLLTGQYSVLEVSHHALFANPSSFSQAFLREFNESPSDVKESSSRSTVE